jgi:hypothetical protein
VGDERQPRQLRGVRLHAAGDLDGRRLDVNDPRTSLEQGRGPVAYVVVLD